MRFAVLTVGLLLLGAQGASAAGTEGIGTGVAIALPMIAGGISLAKTDWTGMAELGVDTVATVGIAYGLGKVTHERRPDGSDYKSFPSDTAALAFAPAQYLWDRYGWQYGLPAYAAAGFVAYSRVDARKHHWYDVTASAVLAFGIGKLVDTPYHGHLVYGAGLADGGGYASLQYRF
jgi:membrane-associated phospholipid phosphatase